MIPQKKQYSLSGRFCHHPTQIHPSLLRLAVHITLQSVALQLKRHNPHPLCFKIHAVLLCIDYLLNIAAFRNLKVFSTSLLYVNINKKMLCYRTMAFFFLGKQSTWNFNLQFLCSVSNHIIRD